MSAAEEPVRITCAQTITLGRNQRGEIQAANLDCTPLLLACTAVNDMVEGDRVRVVMRPMLSGES